MNSALPVLHVVNACVDGSISRIVERIIGFSNTNEFEWHVCAVKEMGAFSHNFETAGARVVDCSSRRGDPKTSGEKIKKYIIDQQIRIVHSHTPRTILEVWRALNWYRPLTKDVMHLATKHLLTGPKDRSWGTVLSFFDRLTLYPPDHLVTVSRTMADEIISQPGIPVSKVSAIPNAIPVNTYYRPAEREETRKELNLSPEMLAIGFTGRITKVKNLDLLLDAFKIIHSEFPLTRLILAGEGDLRPALENQARRLGIDSALTWVGFCADIPHFLSAMDIYVQPSLNEGLSLSILEAMAAEKAVIATRVGSADEIIHHGSNGYLVEPGSVEQMAHALRIILNNAEARYCMARQARDFVLQEYNIQKMVNGYYKVYRMLGKMAKNDDE
jgi:glycosyltransferase involved in cell wall biosynthesis